MAATRDDVDDEVAAGRQADDDHTIGPLPEALARGRFEDDDPPGCPR